MLRQEIIPVPRPAPEPHPSRASAGVSPDEGIIPPTFTAYNVGALAIIGGGLAAAGGALIYLTSEPHSSSAETGEDYMKYGSVAALGGLALSLYGFGAG